MPRQTTRTVMGETLTRLRKAHGLTQEQVADILKIKRSTYAYYERNITPTLDIISKLSTLFCVSTHELMYGEPEPIHQFGILNDASSIFSKHTDEHTSGFVFPQLTIREKEMVCRFRLLPDNVKEKICKEIEDYLNKSDE